MISFRMDWLDLLESKGLSRVLSNTTVQKHQFFGTQVLYGPSLISIHDYHGKTIALTRQTFVDKVMSLLFNMLIRLVIAFLPSSKCLLISWLQSPSAMILELPKTKSLTVFIVSPSICHGWHGSILTQTHLPSKLPHNMEQSSMCYIVGPCWLSISNIALSESL